MTYRSNPAAFCIYKVLLSNSHRNSFTSVCGYFHFHIITSDLSSCDMCFVVCKV